MKVNNLKIPDYLVFKVHVMALEQNKLPQTIFEELLIDRIGRIDDDFIEAAESWGRDPERKKAGRPSLSDVKNHVRRAFMSVGRQPSYPYEPIEGWYRGAATYGALQKMIRRPLEPWTPDAGDPTNPATE